MRMVVPPYPFLDRGATASVIITETDGWTIVHPNGPLTDSYTIRLATVSTHAMYVTYVNLFKAAQIEPAGPIGPTVPILPVTGADTTPLIAGGMLFFFGGILLLIASRRRRTHAA